MTADKKDRLGVWPFVVDDPAFNRYGQAHDWHYSDKENGTQFEPKTREQVDEEFRNNVNREIKFQGTRWAKLRGEFYKFVATALGRFFW